MFYNDESEDAITIFDLGLGLVRSSARLKVRGLGIVFLTCTFC